MQIKLTWLAGLESQTEEFVHDAVAYFQNLDESILNTPSTTGGWSIAQCLGHLNTYGHYYLPRLQQEIEKEPKKPLSDKYMSSWLGAYLIRITDTQTSSMKLKAVRKHQPAGFLPAHQVVAEFIDQQETMLHLLRMAQQADVNQFRIPLSIASWIRLPLGDVLHFMVVHTQRHMIQAKRNIPRVKI